MMYFNVPTITLTEIALGMFVAGVVLLLESMRGQSTQVAKLRQQILESTEAQARLHNDMTDLREHCANLLLRQKRIETRRPDERRIDLAVRMLKRGTGDTQTLQDLGLSAGEAKLMLRLQNAPIAAKTSAPKRRPLAAQGQSLARMLES